MITTYTQEDEIVGVSIHGEPLTQKDLETQIEKGEKQINKGEFYSIQELENISKEWFNTK